jgi:hypothetical protein
MGTRPEQRPHRNESVHRLENQSPVTHFYLQVSANGKTRGFQPTSTQTQTRKIDSGFPCGNVTHLYSSGLPAGADAESASC